MMMNKIITLKRTHFKDNPKWHIVKEDIPIGTEYIHQYDFPPNKCTLLNILTNEIRPVMCIRVHRNKPFDKPGWLPQEIFEE